MISTLIISGITCIELILSILFLPQIKIKNIRLKTYIIIAFVGALFILLFGVVPFSELKTKLLSDTSINPIKILILFFSMTIMSIYLDEVGFFKYIAYKSLKIAKSSQLVLFIIIYDCGNINNLYI